MNKYWDIVIEPHEFLFDSVFLICYERPMKSACFLNKCFDYQVLFKMLVVSVFIFFGFVDVELSPKTATLS